MKPSPVEKLFLPTLLAQVREMILGDDPGSYLLDIPLRTALGTNKPRRKLIAIASTDVTPELQAAFEALLDIINSIPDPTSPSHDSRSSSLGSGEQD